MTQSSFDRFENSKTTLESNSKARFLERWSSPHTHPGGSVIRLGIQKLRVVVMFLLRRLVSGPGRSNALSGLEALAGSARGKEVLVIGSGPSAEKINSATVAKAQKAGELIVVATNYFLSSPLAKTITPDFLVWSDEVFHPRHRSSQEAWGLLESHDTVTVVSPWTWHGKIPHDLRSRFIFFDNDTLETWSTNISPLRPRGYQGTTGTKALALGIHLQPRTTFLIGLDLSYFQNFSVDSDNRLHRHPTHMVGTDSGVQDLSALSVSGIADALYSTANQFYYLRRLFAGSPVINLDPNSLVDAFPKAGSHPYIKAPRNRTTGTKK